jgi:hypothetical protein
VNIDGRAGMIVRQAANVLELLEFFVRRMQVKPYAAYAAGGYLAR